MKKTTLTRLDIKPHHANAEQITIWQIPLHDEPSWAFSLLNAKEQTRANRYHFARHRRRFTTARAMLRVILGKICDREPAALRIDTQKHGKPFLPEFNEIAFNLSDSGEYALIAVGFKHALGIDLEIFSSRDYLGLSRQVFSAAEQQALAALPSTLLPLGFFNAWSQKEAFIKALGLGLAYDTQSFCVPLIPQGAFELEDNRNTRWQMHPFMPFPGCSAALCCHTNIRQIDFHQLKTLAHITPGVEQ